MCVFPNLQLNDEALSKKGEKQNIYRFLNLVNYSKSYLVNLQSLDTVLIFQKSENSRVSYQNRSKIVRFILRCQGNQTVRIGYR